MYYLSLYLHSYLIGETYFTLLSQRWNIHTNTYIQQTMDIFMNVFNA